MMGGFYTWMNLIGVEGGAVSAIVHVGENCKRQKWPFCT